MATRRILLRLLAAAVMAGAQSDILDRGEAAGNRRMRVFYAWLRGETVSAPSWWTVRSERDLTSESVGAGAGYDLGSAKTLKTSTIEADNGMILRVVVKTPVRGARGAEAAKEAAYLEALRGEAGVPELYGGWLRDGRPSFVVADCGPAIGTGAGTEASPAALSESYREVARRKPLKLARSWLALGHAFAELGGYAAEDLAPREFSLKDEAVFLVDGPRPVAGPPGASARTVFDFANRPWILPEIARLAESARASATLDGLIAKMSAEDPAARPTFAACVDELDAGGGGALVPDAATRARRHSPIARRSHISKALHDAQSRTNALRVPEFDQPRSVALPRSRRPRPGRRG